MTARLRSLALTVEEPDPGCYYWGILEAFPDSNHYHLLSLATAAESSYARALERGVEAMRGLSVNSRDGPRDAKPRPADAPSSDWTPLGG